MSLEERIARVLADPLGGARPAGVAGIGYVGVDIPIELILAAAASPIRLFGTSGDATANADRYLEDSFSPQSRSIAEQWLTGRLDSLGTVIFSRSDDSAQRLYYYICELQRRGRCAGPTPLLYDIARIKRATSLQHTIASTQRLAVELGVDEHALPAAVRRVNARLALLARLTEMRAAPDAPNAVAVHRVLRASQLDWSTDFDDALERWLEQVPLSRVRHRVLLIGSTPPDERLHSAVESAGASIVGEVDESIALTVRTSLRPASAIEGIAHRCYRAIGVVRSLLQAPQEICRHAQALGVHGVVIWMIAEDTGLAWEAPRIAHALREAGLPVLTLTRQAWLPGPAVLDELTRFARALDVGT